MEAPRRLLVVLLLVLAPLIGFLATRACLEWTPSPPLMTSISPPTDASPVSPAAGNTGLPLRTPVFGMNVSAVVDWSREWAFVDVFKSSRPWTEIGPKPFEFDRLGYPKLRPDQRVETLMVREIDGHYPAGRYVATWKGAGQVDLSRFDVASVLSQKPGRIEVQVKPNDGGLLLAINATSAADPLRDMHVWMPGFEDAGVPFHPLFLKRLDGFRVIRFMAWQNTVNSTVRTWAERAKPDDARYTNSAGVPIELMVDLANRLHAAPWFSMPHQADDEYVKRFAELVHERLAPDLPVYVEYSNEIWNWAFSETKYAHEEGKRLHLGNPEALRYYSQRSVEIFRLWEQAFGGHKRLVRVLATQAVNLWGSEQVLAWNSAYQHADALAIAPYFGYEFGDPKTADDVAHWSVDRLLDKLSADVDGANRAVIRAQAQLAKKFGLDLIAYEGGPHLAGLQGAENNHRLTELFIAANRHPRMHDIYRRHLENWFEAGGGLYAAFAYVSAPSKWGSWGLLEYQDQPLDQAPKMRAVVELMTAANGK